MKKYISLIILLVSISSFGQLGYKQYKSFSTKPEKFIKELNSFMSQTKIRKDDIDKLMKPFTKLWVKDSLSDTYKNDVIKISNLLLKRRARQATQFYEYINSIMNFYNSTQSDASYNAWTSGLTYILSKRRKSLKLVQQILQTTPSAINESIFYKTSSVQWKASGTDLEYVFNNNQLKIKFDNDFDLVCYSKKDSIKIEKTNGIFNLETAKFTGANGLVTWERTGLSRDSVYAHLSKYEINTNKSEYVADSVKFINLYYFKEPVLGQLIDKVKKIIKPKQSTYPQFKTYLSRFEINDIYKYVNYSGGFYMKGAKLIGSGTEKAFAYLYFYRKDTLVIKAKAKQFIFKPNGIISNHTEIVIKLEQDSIYHPGLMFKYNSFNKTIQLIRNDEGTARIKFFDSYHKVEIDAKQMEWQMETPKINLQGITQSDNRIVFESNNYYSDMAFQKLQGNADHNPLNQVKRFSIKLQSDEFYDLQFADFLGISEPAVHRYLLALSYQGFIQYNFKTGLVKIKPKLNDYILASINKKDYDVMRFISDASDASNEGVTKKGIKRNAYLSLLNYNINIAGVRLVHLSDSQNVSIYPAGGKIILKKNRNFDFSGKVLAGMFLYKGTNFSFDYDKFKLDLPDIREMKMQAKTGEIDQYGLPVMRTVRNKIENMSGELLIDDPMNKSGLKDYPRYPIFYSKKDAYVYYDSKKIQKGVYKRDNFYFQVFPYEMDSLNSIDGSRINFEGHFVSAGIFPPFDETLRVMPDLSLGFNRKTPPTGYPVYGGKAKYNNVIDLSNKGLRGDGDLKYVTSITKSKEFFFYPDSLNARATTFENREEKSPIEFPQVHGEECNIHFMPYQDELYTSKYKTPIQMFNKQAITHGTTILTPSGMKGFGVMEFAEAKMTSNEYKYKQNTFTSDTANFQLKAKTEVEGIDFSTKNVNALIDFNRRLGEFVANDGNSVIEFPKNQYICFMDKFTWYMDKDEITLSSTKKNEERQKIDTTGLSPVEIEDIELEGSQFISIHPHQDSLNFWAPTATYRRMTSTITANDVKFIRVADATIYPGDGKVVIHKKAKMDSLVNSKIKANNTTRYHTFYNSTTYIYGKKDYMAHADYDYIDENRQKEKIHFDKIEVDSTVQTVAYGRIGVTQDFTLSPHFAYTGKVKIEASKEHLMFDGYFKINHQCETMKKHWVGFEGEINPKDIFIPISDNLMDINGKRLHSSFMITNDTVHIYTAFLSTDDFYTDNEMIPVEGYIHYNKENGKYEISNKDKLEEFNMPGSYISLHPTICNAYSEGIINLAIDLGQIKYKAAGNITGNLPKDKYQLDLLLGFDFFFNDKCLDLMAKELAASSNDGVDFDRSVYTKAVTELVGKEKAEKYFTGLNMGNFKKYPEELLHTILFNELQFEWNSKKRAYVSIGDIGVGAIGKHQINQLFKGKIEIIKKRSGDELTIYLETSEGGWYFMQYRRSVFRIGSSNKDFNNIILATKADDRRVKPKKGEKSYTYHIATAREMRKFKKKYFSEDGDEEEQSGEKIEGENNNENNNSEEDSTEDEGFGGDDE